MKKMKINTEFIKLGQLLKLASFIEQGSDAKALIAEGLVKVNGAVCTQRGKKIYHDDVVALENEGEVKVISVIN